MKISSKFVFRHEFMFYVSFLIKCYNRKLQDSHGTFSKIQGCLSESLEAYASIAVAVVWISSCFTESQSRKLQTHVFIRANGTFF